MPPDDLPQDEPLTPELLEDEAQRGDFMIRWAVVLLAFLLGCAEVGDTQALLHVKTGQYLWSHGILPPRSDPFAFTTEGRTWVNLSWGFDLLAGAVYGLGGVAALSVWKGLMAAATFGFVVQTGLPGVSTWWRSILALLALLVCHSQFSVRPEAVTLLGGAALLWSLVRWRQAESSTLKWLPLLFLLWANLDPRAFLGLAFLLMFATGEFVSAWLGQPAALSERRRRHLAAVVAASFVVVAVHPFGWHVWTSPWRLYAVEYPAFRQYYAQILTASDLQYRPLTAPAFWTTLSHFGVAWLTLLAAAAIAQALNVRRLRWGMTLVFLASLAMAMGAIHELSLTALALAVVATVNAEEWYRASFRQGWTVSRGEILFSRGGRAATVLGFVVLGLVAVLGRLPMPNQERIGLGWQPQLANQIASLREELGDEFDDRPFHPYLRQGDLLIWIGQRSFIDHRIALFAGKDAENLIALHDDTRRALRKPTNKDRSKPRTSWKPAFDRFGMTHVVPSLASTSPDFQTVVDLLGKPEWNLARLGAAVAVFYRTDLTEASYLEFRRRRASGFVEKAFRRPEPIARSERTSNELGRNWPSDAASSSVVLVPPRVVLSPTLQEAQNHQRLLQEAMHGGWQPPADTLAAVALLVIQKCEQGLSETPESAEAFRLLGSAHDVLGTLEATYAASQSGSSADLRRFYAATLAYAQSLRLEPTQPILHLRLAELYAAHSKFDIALRHLEAGERQLTAVARRPSGDEPLPAEFARMKTRLQGAVETGRRAVDAIPEAERRASPETVPSTAYRQGCILLALDHIRNESGEFDSTLPGALFHAQALMEAGLPWDAEPILRRIEQQFGRDASASEWRSLAAIVALSRGAHEHAVQLWEDELRMLTLEHFIAATESLPIVSRPSAWPLAQLRSANGLMRVYPQQSASVRFHLALTHLELGAADKAEALLRAIARETPETSLRPLVRLYLAQISGELIDAAPPSDRIPVGPDLFAPEPGTMVPKGSTDGAAEAETPSP